MRETIIVGSDHAGFDLKERVKEWLEVRGFAVEDVGTRSPQQVDYPDYAHLVARAVGSGKRARGVLICGTGIGVSIAANRHAGVRAAVVCGEETARLAREHNDSNVLALGGRTLDPAIAERILDVWLSTPFAGGRHERRVKKIDQPESDDKAAAR
jgi:ribose 5-phosphate isomerase B